MKADRRIRSLICAAALGVLIQLMSSCVMNLVFAFFPMLANRYSDLLSGFIRYDIKSILYICVFSPLLEEFLFRGFMLLGYKLLIKAKAPISKKGLFYLLDLIQSLLFAFYHGNPIQGVYAFILGLFIGWLVFGTFSIMSGVVFHVFVNTSSLLLYRYGNADLHDPVFIAAFPLLALLSFFLIRSIRSGFINEDGALR